MNQFQPELGQAAFGQQWSQYECPSFVEAGLQMLASEIERVEWNIRQEEYEAPTANNGGEYKTEVFEMRAYCWGDCVCGDEFKADCRACQPNFKCRDLEVRWYKWVGRGTSMNREIDANAFFELIDLCVDSVRSRETAHFGNR